MRLCLRERFEWPTTPKRRTWNTRDGCDSSKPTALFSLIGHVILSVKPIPHAACVRPSTRLPFSPARVEAARLQTDTLIDQLWRWPLYCALEIRSDFFFPLKKASRYTFPPLSPSDYSGFGRLFFYLFIFEQSLSKGDIPQEAIRVHNHCDHPCGIAQHREQLWLINQSVCSGAGGEPTGKTAPLHQESWSIWKNFFKELTL